MAKITSKYETVFIINPNLSEEEIAALRDKFTTLITNQGGVLGEIDEWGKRRLAYPIQKLNEGHYVVVNFEAPPALPAELDRVFRITDGVLRSIIICKDE